MLRRRNDVAVGEYMRRGLEPMAKRLGIDHDIAFFTPPASNEARVYDAYRCGESLLMAFTYPDGWAVSDANPERSPKRARRAAKRLRSALVEDVGRHAISYMTQGYAREMAALWRRASASGEYPSEADGLIESAERSEALGELAALHWPVSDPFGALDEVAGAAQHRFVDPDNPGAMIDLHSYYGRAATACGAAALALGADFDEFGAFLIAPVMALDIGFSVGLQAGWNFQGEIWRNLISDVPRPYVDSTRRA